ncbi:MAG: cyclophilin-like fold protein, partial [Planctomycetota bacterium]
MGQAIVIRAGDHILQAQLNDGVTGKAIYDALPIRAQAQRWGGEIYFSIPASCELETGSREVLEVGELAYWPPGRA